MEKWKGIAKLIEESGELNQVLGKIIAFPDGNHPDPKFKLTEKLVEELADAKAAIEYFADRNLGEKDHINYSKRTNRKYNLFYKWDLSGLMK